MTGPFNRVEPNDFVASVRDSALSETLRVGQWRAMLQAYFNRTLRAAHEEYRCSHLRLTS